MSEDLILRAKARQAIATGQIPNRRPDRMVGGRAYRGACRVCGLPTKLGEVVLEAEFITNDGESTINHDLHIACFLALEEEFNAREPGWAGGGFSVDETLHNKLGRDA